MARTLVTVNTLATQARQRGEIILPADALITPAAADWLATTRVPVRRLTGEGSSTAPPDDNPNVYLVGDAAHATIRTLWPQMRRRWPHAALRPCNGNRTGLLEATLDVCRSLGTCSRHRAVVVVKSVAIVACVANKFAHVRAAIAARPSAMFGLIEELGVNMLLIENEQMSVTQMLGLIDRFLAASPRVDPRIAQAIASAGGSAPNTGAETPAGEADCACG